MKDLDRFIFSMAYKQISTFQLGREAAQKQATLRAMQITFAGPSMEITSHQLAMCKENMRKVVKWDGKCIKSRVAPRVEMISRTHTVRMETARSGRRRLTTKECTTLCAGISSDVFFSTFIFLSEIIHCLSPRIFAVKGIILFQPYDFNSEDK